MARSTCALPSESDRAAHLIEKPDRISEGPAHWRSFCLPCLLLGVQRTLQPSRCSFMASREVADGMFGGGELTAKKIRSALEKAGIEFIAENGGSPDRPVAAGIDRRTRAP